MVFLLAVTHSGTGHHMARSRDHKRDSAKLAFISGHSEDSPLVHSVIIYSWGQNLIHLLKVPPHPTCKYLIVEIKFQHDFSIESNHIQAIAV